MSKEYFYIRNLSCQWSAYLKKQSQPITNSEREKMIKLIESKVSLGESPPFDPNIFGGYIIIPYKFEFWQGKEFRIHDRQIFYLEEGYSFIQSLLENVDSQDYSTFLDFSKFPWKWCMLDS